MVLGYIRYLPLLLPARRLFLDQSRQYNEVYRSPKYRSTRISSYLLFGRYPSQYYTYFYIRLWGSRILVYTQYCQPDRLNFLWV